MKKLFLMPIITLCIMVVGCQSLNFGSNMMKINEGMSQKEVKSILGNPSQRSFDSGIDVWEYNIAYSQTHSQICIIKFIDGRVISMDTYTEPMPRKPHEHKHGGKGRPH